MKKTKVFCIYDTKAKYYKNPFLMKSTGEALRGFEDVAKDEKTEIGRHPTDFILFQIAEFDEDNGVYENLKQPKNLGLASDYLPYKAKTEETPMTNDIINTMKKGSTS